MKYQDQFKNDKGAAMMVAVIFFLFAGLVVILGIVNPILKQATLSKNIVISKSSYFLAEGAVEEIYSRLQTNKQISSTETLSLNNGVTTSIISDTSLGKKITSAATTTNNVRKVELNLLNGTGASFNYGIQSGRGGFVLENTARITGNVYSNGTITGSGNTIYGDAVSASTTGSITGIHVTGSAFSHSITNSTVDGNAYYVNKTSTTVGGTSYPNSPDQPNVPLPISDSDIQQMEADALAGGVISSPCPYKITSSRTLGPIKIDCDLEISGGPTVTLAGPVWVNGNISMKNTAVIQVSSALGASSAAFIADKPTDRINSSKIDLDNSIQFFGSGSATSFVFMFSQNESAENGGSIDAISMDNTASGRVILYSNHGLISINNSATLRQVTGYTIKAKNSANIVYDTGLVSTLFSSGPAGGYDVLGWQEVK